MAGKQTTGGPTLRKVSKGELWTRRIISTAVLLALVAGVVFAAVKLVGWVSGMLSTEQVKATQSSVPKQATIGSCEPSDLSVVLTPSSTALDQGTGLDVGIELQTEGESDCSFNTEDLSIKLAVEGEIVWTPTACSSSWARLLLLSPGQPWSSSISWDGVAYVDCEAAMVPGPDNEDGSAGAKVPAYAAIGMYDLTASVSGEMSKEHRKFDPVRIEIR